MPQPTPAEVLPKALAREALPAAPPAGSAAEMAKKINQKVDEGAWSEALELGRRAPVEERKIQERIEEIGINRDPATGAKQRNAQEQARYNEAKNVAALAKKFIEKGYGGLTAAEQNTLQLAVLAEANLRPALALEIAAMTAA